MSCHLCALESYWVMGRVQTGMFFGASLKQSLHNSAISECCFFPISQSHWGWRKEFSFHCTLLPVKLKTKDLLLLWWRRIKRHKLKIRQKSLGNFFKWTRISKARGTTTTRGYQVNNIWEAHYCIHALNERTHKGIWLWIALLLSVGWNSCHCLIYVVMVCCIYVCTKPNCIIILRLERINWTPLPLCACAWMVGKMHIYLLPKAKFVNTHASECYGLGSSGRYKTPICMMGWYNMRMTSQ